MLKKFPRTPHLPSSCSATSDDKWLSKEGLANLQSGVELIVTEKMDGSNYNMTRERAYARSVDGVGHPWDKPARRLWEQVRWDIPEDIRLSGESLYGRRSVAYEGLSAPFLLFGVWEGDTLLSWDDMSEWAELLGLQMVPLIYRGHSFDEAISAWSARGYVDDSSEGFVVREAGAIAYDEYGLHVGKWVRANHVRTEDTWRHRDDFAVNSFTTEYF